MRQPYEPIIMDDPSGMQQQQEQAPPQSLQQGGGMDNAGSHQQPVNFQPNSNNQYASRRVTIGGMHGNNPNAPGGNAERRGSLASVGLMDDLLGRRPSLGFDMNMDSFFAGRRDSMDSTAALDAAILDLTRRRYSMAMGGGGPGMPGSEMGQGGHHGGMNPMNVSINNSSMRGSMDGSMTSPGGGSYGAMGAGSMGMGAPSGPSSVSAIALRQQQLQAEQRQLELKQKELELQRQELIASMQKGSYYQDQPYGQMYPHRSSMMMGSLGLGSTTGSVHSGGLDFGGSHHRSLGLGSVHSQGSMSMHQPHRSSVGSGGSGGGGGQRWWICQVCNSKAFASQEEAMAHESICQEGPRKQDPFHPSPFPMAGGEINVNRNFSLGMDSSGHSYPDTTSMSHGPFAKLDKPMPLAMPSDKDWLTPLHCFVRQYCVEVFTATEHDVATPSKGKRKPIQVGQVGIRCPHCHSNQKSEDSSESKDGSKARERGSVYYPTTISSIYNATMNLLQRHLHNCPSVPDDIMRRYDALKADDARSGTSKRYWVESALSLGLVDTPSGIRYSSSRHPPLPNASQQHDSLGQSSNRRDSNEFFSTTSNATKDVQQQNQDNVSNDEEDVGDAKMEAGQFTDTGPLVSPEDKPYSTKFSYHLLSQMQPCVFTEADRLGKRKGLPPGFPGLACRHCFGGYGSGRFFPSSIKTLSDTSKTLNVLYNHMLRCRKCPPEVREMLESLRSSHDEERAKMKFGSQKAFFQRIWERLHGKDFPPALKARRGGYGRQPVHHMGGYGGMQERGFGNIPQGQNYPMQRQSHAGGSAGLEALAKASDPKRQKI